MFKLHTPQSLTLTVPGEDGPFTLVNFRTNGADTSRCIMEIVTPDGATHRLTFLTGGHLVDQQFIAGDNPEDPEARPLTPADYIVDGRDTRADNPYTHVAPVDADTAYRDGQTPGYRAPEPRTDEEKKAAEDNRNLQEKAHEEAADRARKTRGKTLDRLDEKPEDKAERAHKERRERLEKGFEEQDKADAAKTSQGVEQVGEPERNPDGSLSSIPPEPSRDPEHYDPLIPAASSPLPGSPPPHRADSPNPTGSKITRSGTFNDPQPAEPYRP